MHVQVVDPSAYTPPYDHALCSALAAKGLEAELVTSSFDYGQPPEPAGYRRNEFFYRHAVGVPGSKSRTITKALAHVPDMLRFRRYARTADIVHFQWLGMQLLDLHLLPRDRLMVLTAHDVLPREPRFGALHAQRKLYEAVDAVVVHSRHGQNRLTEELQIDPAKIHVIPHGVFDYLADPLTGAKLPPELTKSDRPVVLYFGLIRPYKGVDVLLDAWREVKDAELWVVGMPKMPVEELKPKASDNVKFVSRFVSDGELAACFNAAATVVLPYREIDQSGVLYTAMAFNKPMVLTDVGGFSEIAERGVAELVPPGDSSALAAALQKLVWDDSQRAAMQAAARREAATTYSWEQIATQTIELYQSLAAGR